MPLEAIELIAEYLLVFPLQHQSFCKKSFCILRTHSAHSIIKNNNKHTKSKLSLTWCSTQFTVPHCFTLIAGAWYHTNFPQSVHNINFPEGQKQYIRKYHLLFRDITGNLHFHFVKCYYFGLTRHIISLSQSVRIPESYKERERKGISVLAGLPLAFHGH